MNVSTSPFPVLNTSRLILHALHIGDHDNLFQLRSKPEVNKYLERDKSPTLTDVDEFIRKIGEVVKNKEGLYWVITLKGTNKLIGTVCYWNFNRGKEMAELGYELLPEYQGNGLMQESLTEVIKYAWDDMQLEAIGAVTHPDNESSVKLLSRLNFRRDDANKFVSKEDACGLQAYVLIK